MFDDNPAYVLYESLPFYLKTAIFKYCEERDRNFAVPSWNQDDYDLMVAYLKTLTKLERAIYGVL
jgi:hypothetical protein